MLLTYVHIFRIQEIVTFYYIITEIKIIHHSPCHTYIVYIIYLVFKDLLHMNILLFI